LQPSCNNFWTVAVIKKIRQGLTPTEWLCFGGMVATIIGLNMLGWRMLTAALGGHYHIGKTTVFGVGTGALAYTLGMRHAFDADHIGAIDNTTRAQHRYPGRDPQGFPGDAAQRLRRPGARRAAEQARPDEPVPRPAGCRSTPSCRCRSCSRPA
jgi:hypothetical protein